MLIISQLRGVVRPDAKRRVDNPLSYSLIACGMKLSLSLVVLVRISLTIEGGAAAVPGRDAASQDTLYGAPVEVAEYPGVHVEPPQPAEEEDIMML